jgi:hypothetical protein
MLYFWRRQNLILHLYYSTLVSISHLELRQHTLLAEAILEAQDSGNWISFSKLTVVTYHSCKIYLSFLNGRQTAVDMVCYQVNKIFRTKLHTKCVILFVQNKQIWISFCHLSLLYCNIINASLTKQTIFSRWWQKTAIFWHINLQCAVLPAL